MRQEGWPRLPESVPPDAAPLRYAAQVKREPLGALIAYTMQGVFNDRTAAFG